MPIWTVPSFIDADRLADVTILAAVELEVGRQHLLHQKRAGDGLEHVVDRVRHDRGLHAGLGDEVGELRVGLAGGVAGGPTDDLDDLGEGGAVSDRERVLAPGPVEAFLGHAERDDDVDLVAIGCVVALAVRALCLATAARPSRASRRLPSSTRSAIRRRRPSEARLTRSNPVSGSRPSCTPILSMIMPDLVGLLAVGLGRAAMRDVDDRLLVGVEDVRDRR